MFYRIFTDLEYQNILLFLIAVILSGNHPPDKQHEPVNFSPGSISPSDNFEGREHIMVTGREFIYFTSITEFHTAGNSIPVSLEVRKSETLY